MSASACLACAQGAIYPDPGKAPAGFKPHELAFETPKDGLARSEYRSAPFYAVILKTAARCSVSEKERREVQSIFPKNKVFATRFECDGEAEQSTTYTNVNAKFGFIAVYAGETQPQAEDFLERIRSSGLFAGANLRRMQAVRVYP